MSSRGRAGEPSTVAIQQKRERRNFRERHAREQRQRTVAVNSSACKHWNALEVLELTLNCLFGLLGF